MPDDLPEGFQLPMCSTWGHLICMRVAETSAWAGQCGAACVGQRPCLPAAASRPAAPPALELGNCNEGLGVRPTRSASPGSRPVSIASLCEPVSILNFLIWLKSSLFWLLWFYLPGFTFISAGFFFFLATDLFWDVSFLTTFPLFVFFFFYGGVFSGASFQRTVIAASTDTPIISGAKDSGCLKVYHFLAKLDI